MIATLVVEYADGTTAAFCERHDVEDGDSCSGGWQEQDFDDSGWKVAVMGADTADRSSSALGHPWIPDSVKALRHPFDVKSPVKSARLVCDGAGRL